MVFGELGDLPAEFAQRIVLFFPRTLSYPTGSAEHLQLAVRRTAGQTQHEQAIDRNDQPKGKTNDGRRTKAGHLPFE